MPSSPLDGPPGDTIPLAGTLFYDLDLPFNAPGVPTPIPPAVKLKRISPLCRHGVTPFPVRVRVAPAGTVQIPAGLLFF